MPLRTIYIILFILFPILGRAQDGLRLKMVSAKDTIFFNKHFSYQTDKFFSTDLVKIELKELLNKMYDNGYMAATYDSVFYGKKKVTAYLQMGEVYKWLSLKNGNVDESILNQVGFREKFFNGKTVHFKKVRQLQESLLEYVENNGYPFATIRLDSFKIEGNNVAARIYIDKNIEVYVDSITIEGDAKINKPYLYNYLGIKENSLYDESRISKIKPRLKDLLFLKEEKPFNILFKEDRATINLFLKDKPASRLNGILGVLPNNKTTGKLLITGEVEASLKNPFGTGKKIELKWRKLEANTQDLKIKFNYPYVLSTPLGLDLDFQLYKRDTLYIDLIKELGIQYLMIGNNYVKVFVKNKTTSLLSIDSVSIVQTRKLPNNIDINTTSYGLGYKLTRLDNRLNPRKGLDLEMKGGVGTKKIKMSTAIIGLTDPFDTTFDFTSLYDSINLSSIEYEVTYDLSYYFPLFKRAVVKLQTQGGGVWNEKIFENDMFRIGGMNKLRGFDEESILASFYNIFTTELRYLLSQNSYTSLFADVAYYEDNLKRLYEWAYGFGAGISFETKAGIFSLSYALGKQFSNPISFKSAKIHFGYVNYF